MAKPRILSQPPVFKRGIEVNRHVPYRDSTLTLLLLVRVSDDGYDQLVGKSYSRDVHAHVAKRRAPKAAAPAAPAAPAPVKAPEPRDTWDRHTPMNPQQVPKVTPRERPRETAKVRPDPAGSVPSAPTPSAPSKLRPDPTAEPQKPPYILRLEESARAFARVNREKRPNRKGQGPASARSHKGHIVQSGASIGSASTASTTPESVRKRLLAGSEAYSAQGGLERNGGLQLLPPLRAGGHGLDSHRRKLEAEAAGRHPDIPLLQDAIFLPALEEDWHPRQSHQSPKKAHGSPQLWSRPPKRAPEPPRDAPNRSPPKLLRPPGLAPGYLVKATFKLSRFQIFLPSIGGLGMADAVDMRTILGELDAKHAESKEVADAGGTWQASTWPRQSAQ
eukprot:Skav221115  [mRNA]  locus=scaffold233:226132:232369:- [translate_table: standard]